MPGSEVSQGDLSHASRSAAGPRRCASAEDSPSQSFFSRFAPLCLHAAVLVTPAVKRLLSDTSSRFTASAVVAPSPARRSASLELADDLFRGMPSGHLSSLPPSWASDSHRYWTSSPEAGKFSNAPCRKFRAASVLMLASLQVRNIGDPRVDALRTGYTEILRLKSAWATGARAAMCPLATTRRTWMTPAVARRLSARESGKFNYRPVRIRIDDYRPGLQNFRESRDGRWSSIPICSVAGLRRANRNTSPSKYLSDGGSCGPSMNTQSADSTLVFSYVREILPLGSCNSSCTPLQTSLTFGESLSGDHATRSARYPAHSSCAVNVAVWPSFLNRVIASAIATVDTGASAVLREAIRASSAPRCLYGLVRFPIQASGACRLRRPG